jgi:vacuolar-type H+-ATPase subunit I/STV1
MEEWITITEYNWAYWVAGFFALAELFRWLFTFKDWFFKTVGIETKGMREKREWNERLKHTEDAIKEIKETSKHNVEMFLDHEKQVVEKFTDIKDEIVSELNKLHDKIDEQKEEMDKTNEANAKTDCAMLRDRIASGMRYFSQNKDADGNVHISFSDYENMEALFQEYFAKDGNGAFKKAYKTEFQQFIIDR